MYIKDELQHCLDIVLAKKRAWRGEGNMGDGDSHIWLFFFLAVHLSKYKGKKFSISKETDTHSVRCAVYFSVTQTDEFSKLSVIR